MAKWISSKNKLPFKNGAYLCITPDLRWKTNVMWFEDGVWLVDERTFRTANVTHWMELPEPPDGNKD